MTKLRAFIELARPGHWIKNLVVLAAIVFSGNYANWALWPRAALALAAFCMLSSAVYAFNDIFDRQSDAGNPRARSRPIPAGRLGVTEAAIEGMLLLAGGLAVSACLGRRSLAVAVAYVLLNAMYNLGLRRRPIADVVVIAFGFVLRALAGGVAIGVAVSGWLIVCTFTLCLFLALIKRRAEIVLLEPQEARDTRQVHAFYTLLRLDHMLAVSAGLAVATYISYCLGETSPSPHMVWTVPVVLYGMFRLYSLSVGSDPADPVELIRRDKVLWLVALIWAVMVLAVLHARHWPALAGWVKEYR